MDLSTYEQRVRFGACFICGMLRGDPGAEHETLYDDGAHVAFLNRYPTLRGYALVAPSRHSLPPNTSRCRRSCTPSRSRSTTWSRPTGHTSCRSAAGRPTRTSTGISRRCHPASPTASSNTALSWQRTASSPNSRRGRKTRRRHPRGTHRLTPACYGLIVERAAFWRIVEGARAEAGSDTERVAQVLLRRLRELRPAEIEQPRRIGAGPAHGLPARQPIDQTAVGAGSQLTHVPPS
jgi:hypothetical protein